MNAPLVLQLASGAAPTACSCCSRPVPPIRGLQIIQGSEQQVLCPSCARPHAPVLTALLDLAQTADRVARIGRHSVFPPLTALLDLARAAENLTHAVPPVAASG